MSTKSENSNHYFDFDRLRKDLANEKEVRGKYLTTLSSETGIHTSQLTRFLNEPDSAMGVDLTVSVVKWLGRKVEDYTVSRVKAAPHVDTKAQRELRIASAFLNRTGMVRNEGESAIDAMMRLLADAKAKGLLDD